MPPARAAAARRLRSARPQGGEGGDQPVDEPGRSRADEGQEVGDAPPVIDEASDVAAWSGELDRLLERSQRLRPATRRLGHRRLQDADRDQVGDGSGRFLRHSRPSQQLAEPRRACPVPGAPARSSCPSSDAGPPGGVSRAVPPVSPGPPSALRRRHRPAAGGSGPRSRRRARGAPCRSSEGRAGWCGAPRTHHPGRRRRGGRARGTRSPSRARDGRPPSDALPRIPPRARDGPRRGRWLRSGRCRAPPGPARRSVAVCPAHRPAARGRCGRSSRPRRGGRPRPGPWPSGLTAGRTAIGLPARSAVSVPRPQRLNGRHVFPARERSRGPRPGARTSGTTDRRPRARVPRSPGPPRPAR